MSLLEYSTTIKGALFGTWHDEEGLLPPDIREVVAHTRLCPFCNKYTKLVFAASIEIADNTYEYDTLVFECPNCGWWFKYHDEFRGDLSYEVAILKALEETLDEKVCNEITSEIIDLSKSIRNISPKKLEMVVADALKGIYDCEVVHVGQRGDGEVDVLVLDGESPIAVQVKHRINPDRIETVDYIRKFLGGIVIRDFKKGIFVTLAHHFSKGAIAEAKLAEISQYVTSVDLVDCKQLLEMMAITLRRKKHKPWTKLLTSDDWYFATTVEDITWVTGMPRNDFREQVSQYRAKLEHK